MFLELFRRIKRKCFLWILGSFRKVKRLLTLKKTYARKIKLVFQNMLAFMENIFEKKIF